MSNFLKSRRMPWHQNQQRPRLRPTHNLLRFEDDLLLTAMSTASHPHRPGGSVKLAQAPSPLAYILRAR